jgi:hypothetical protein
VALSAAIHGVSSLVSSLAAACSDSPQTVHVAFMSLKPLFFYGKGRHGESHGEEEEGQEENQADIKLQARASYWGSAGQVSRVTDPVKRLNGVRPLLLWWNDLLLSQSVTPLGTGSQKTPIAGMRDEPSHDVRAFLNGTQSP